MKGRGRELREAQGRSAEPRDAELLRYLLLERPGAEAATLLREFYGANPRKRSALYRRLATLRRQGYLRVTAREPAKGAASASCYLVTARGAHVIGERMPRGYRRPQRRLFQQVAQVKRALQERATREGWYLIEENSDARVLLASHLKRVASARSDGRVEPDYMYLRAVPERITPDLALYTGRAAYLVILSHPHAGRAAFRARLKKYAALLPVIEALCVAFSEAQRQEWFAALRAVERVGQANLAGQVRIVGPEEIERLLAGRR